ncbi:MAG: ABC transporter permease [Devosia sp.]|uniref:ABC transporter permease n=1 Tax=Devosia sp. TaxID=1871048 RepID=UPI001A3836CB|nr:ABC transporter permease [Devosia sp.]MBL8599952.1 ABC transporter permease [Devosia sp.]
MTAHLNDVARALGYVLIALILCALLFQLAGYPAPLLFRSIAEGAFLSPRAWLQTLRWAMPLFITATGVIIAFRCGYFNVGAQGQFYMGAIAATWAADGLSNVPSIVALPVVFLCGVAGGALWALWPGWLRIRSGTDEVITTLMGNFIAILVLLYVTSGPLKDPSGTGQAMTSRPISAVLRISGSSGVSPAIMGVVAVVAVVVWLLVNRTAFGVLSSLAGRNPTMTIWQGAPMKRLGLGAFLLSGALAGLAGTVEVLGANGRLVSGFLPAHGFTAILIALVANLSVAASILATLFFGGLAAASLYLPVLVGLPAAAIDLINAAIAVFVTARRWPRRLLLPTWKQRERERRT